MVLARVWLHQLSPSQFRSWQKPFPKSSSDAAMLSERIREVNSVNDTTLCHLIVVLKSSLDILHFRSSQCFRNNLKNHPTEPETQKINHQIGVCLWVGNVPMNHTAKSNSIINTNKLHYFKTGTAKAVTPLSEQDYETSQQGKCGEVPPHCPISKENVLESDSQFLQPGACRQPNSQHSSDQTSLGSILPT